MFNIKYYIKYETLNEIIDDKGDSYFHNAQGWDIITLPLFGRIEVCIYEHLAAKCIELGIDNDCISLTGMSKLN